MVPDRQKVRTDGRTEWRDGRTDDAKTISLRLRRGITILEKMIFIKSYLNKLTLKLCLMSALMSYIKRAGQYIGHLFARIIQGTFSY